MNLRKYARVTVDGARVKLTVKRCEHCGEGTSVWRPDGFRSKGMYLGHLSRVHRRDRRSSIMVSGACPGDVSLSTRHGVVIRGAHRMGLMLRGMRMLAMA